MEQPEKTNSILRQFKKKSKMLINSGIYTEFFYLNKDRKAIEFLVFKASLILDNFFKAFLPKDFRDFVNVKIYNDDEEQINTWFYEKEDLVLILEVNWGFKKQEISMDIDIETFTVTVLDEKGDFYRKIEHNLLNDFLISFLTSQAKILAESFNVLSGKRHTKLENFK